MSVSGIVLAGGRGLRLGREKALERLHNKTLIEWTMEGLTPVCQTILVVVRQEQFSAIAKAVSKGVVIADLYPSGGALGGIYTGLVNSNSFYNIVVGCDMPFVNSNLLNYMLGLAPGFDAVVPETNGMLEPLHAIYSKDCLSPIKKLLGQNKLGISQVFKLIKVRYVCGDEIAKLDKGYLSFFNINTEDDLIRARELVKEEEKCLGVSET